MSQKVSRLQEGLVLGHSIVVLDSSSRSNPIHQTGGARGWAWNARFHAGASAEGLSFPVLALPQHSKALKLEALNPKPVEPRVEFGWYGRKGFQLLGADDTPSGKPFSDSRRRKKTSTKTKTKLCFQVPKFANSVFRRQLASSTTRRSLKRTAGGCRDEDLNLGRCER